MAIPVLAVAIPSLAVAVPSLFIASRNDRWAAVFVLLRLLWLILASALSLWIAVNNSDPLWQGLARA